MPRKSSQPNEEPDMEETVQAPNNQQDKKTNDNLTQMLAAVLKYLSDDENEVIDVEYIFDNTEGLRVWWDEYKERNRQLIEDEIKASLSDLSIEELQRISKQIKERQN